MNDLYKQAEKIENFYIKKLLNKLDVKDENIKYTEGNICYDAIVTLNNSTLMLEAKVRDVTDYVANLIENEGAILEVKKYNSLINARKNLSCKKLYYIYFMKNQNKTYIFDLDKVTLNKTKKVMNNQTYSAGNSKIEKEIYLLSTKEASIIINDKKKQ